MKSLLLLFAVPLLNLAQTPDFGPLTNQRVIGMVQSGVRISEVVRVICGTPTGTATYNLAPSETDQLLRSGVSEEMIKLMAAKQQGLSCPTDNNNVGQRRNNSLRGEALIVSESTPVRLRLTRNLSSTDAKANDIAHFEVLEDVNVKNRGGNFLVIERGATAWGTITDADPKKTMGRGGKVEVTIDFVRLANGDKLALSAAKAGDRHGHVGLIVGLMVPTAVVVWPAAPFWLLMHGKDSTIKDGFDITAYTDGAANLDSLDFESR